MNLADKTEKGVPGGLLALNSNTRARKPRGGDHLRGEKSKNMPINIARRNKTVNREK